MSNQSLLAPQTALGACTKDGVMGFLGLCDWHVSEEFVCCLFKISALSGHQI